MRRPINMSLVTRLFSVELAAVFHDIQQRYNELVAYFLAMDSNPNRVLSFDWQPGGGGGIASMSQVELSGQAYAGATLGDFVDVQPSIDSNLYFWGRVSAADTVSLFATNLTTGTIISPTITFRVRVRHL